MKIHLLISLILLSNINCFSRPKQGASYKKLYEMSDLVCIVRIDKIEVSDTISPDNRKPDFYENYNAHCKVLHVLKGESDIGTIVIPFFQTPDGRPGFNGARPAPFTLNPTYEYLVYLKNLKGDIWVPAAGSYDAAISIKCMRGNLNVKDLKLPEKDIKANQSSEPTLKTPGDSVDV